MSDTRSRRMALSASQKTLQLFHGVENDELNFQKLQRLMLELQQSFAEHQENMKKQLDEQNNDIKKRIENQTKMVKKLEKSLKDKIEQESQSLKDYIDGEIGRMVTRIDNIEERIQRLVVKQEEIEKFDYDTTVIISNLPYEPTEDLTNKVDRLVREGLRLHDIEIVRVLRLNSHTQRPGLVKAQLPRLQDKIRLLNAKNHLTASEEYRRVFIRSSKPHAERVLEQNMKTILAFVPDLNKKYRLTGNGKLVPKLGDFNGLPVANADRPTTGNDYPATRNDGHPFHRPPPNHGHSLSRPPLTHENPHSVIPSANGPRQVYHNRSYGLTGQTQVVTHDELSHMTGHSTPRVNQTYHPQYPLPPPFQDTPSVILNHSETQ